MLGYLDYPKVCWFGQPRTLRRQMKILLSAYACEPNVGSERGIGWNWALGLARLGHEVFVITCGSHHRVAIEEKLSSSSPIPHLNFFYYDLPWWKGPGYETQHGIRTHYYLWQFGAYRLAKHLHREKHFDVAHHITWGVVRLPSFMGYLHIPFTFGPVGGGERTPLRLRKKYSMRGHCVDILRDILNLIVKVDPFMHMTFRKSHLILTKTDETEKIIPRRYRCKVRQFIELGLVNSRDMPVSSTHSDSHSDKFRILFVGRLLHWKGCHMVLDAFKLCSEHSSTLSLTIVGNGPELGRLKSQAVELGISNGIKWISSLPQLELFRLYETHSVMLFPSLHDSSGNVVLEALSRGLPVICLDLGGPSEIIDEHSGISIRTTGCGYEDVVSKLARATLELLTSPTLQQQLRKGAKRRADLFFLSDRIQMIYPSLQP